MVFDWRAVPKPHSLNPTPNAKPEQSEEAFDLARDNARMRTLITLVTGPRRSLSLTLGDTRVYEPQIRARLGTTTHFCERSRQMMFGWRAVGGGL